MFQMRATGPTRESSVSRRTAELRANADKVLDRKVLPLHVLIQSHLLVRNSVVGVAQVPPLRRVVSRQEIHSRLLCFIACVCD